MSVTVTNLVEGPGTLYWGLFGSVTEPTDANINQTPTSSASGASGYTDVGGTNGGITLEIDQTYTELEVDQIVDSAGRRLTKREVMCTTNLAEPSLPNLSLGLNGGTVATGANFQSYDPLYSNSATQPIYAAFVLEGWAPAGLPGQTAVQPKRRFIGRKALNTQKVTFAMKKDGQSFWSVGLNLHYVSASIPLFHFVDQLS